MSGQNTPGGPLQAKRCVKVNKDSYFLFGLFFFFRGEFIIQSGRSVAKRPKGNDFSAVLVINKVSILAILNINRIWFLHSTLELVMFFQKKLFFVIIDKTINKTLPSLCLGQLCQPQQPYIGYLILVRSYCK